MIRVKGTWRARVEQDFEIEVDSEDEIEAVIERGMEPANVIELVDFEYEIESQQVIA